MTQYISSLYTSSKLMIQLGVEFGIPMKLVRLIKMCLREMYSRVWVGKHLSDMFPIRIVLNKGMPHRHCFSLSSSSYR
jgi:hypothetical protein